MSLSVSSKLLLNNGTHLPVLGFGTYRIHDNLLGPLLRTVVQSGYRLIDTAPLYKNEPTLADFLKNLPQYGLKRSDVFVASKVPPIDQGTEKCRASANGILERLGLDKLDLLLLHWPGVQGMKPNDPKQAQLRKESWLELENLYKKGKFSAIGVSNYTVRHLQELLTYCTVRPAVNQVEFHPHLVQEDLLRFCKDHQIVLQAYSSLGAATGVSAIISEPVIVDIANHYQKTPAQVVLRWALQLGIALIPKSTKEERIKENSQIFDFCLSEDEVASITGLNQSKHYCWDPSGIM